MMVVTMSPQTCEIEVREGFSLALPKFLWAVLEARAKAMHDGDLKATMQELVHEELFGWFIQASRKVIPVPAPSPN